MKEPTSFIDPDLLLRNSEWLCRLARGLVGPDRADDLAQETLIEGLRSRVVLRTSTRAWLAGIARNIARRTHRREAGRRSRELERSESGFAPAADELLLRAELQRQVIDAVTELDEPYRITVLLHYFEGLSVEELSRRTGVRSSTARTRLKRALERLRARLDAHYGARESWGAMAVALAMSGPKGAGLATSATSVGEVISMSGKVKVSVGIATACGAALLGIQTFSESRGETARASDTEPGVAQDVTGEPETTAVERDVASASGRTEVTANPGMRELLVFGSLRTSEGEPVGEAWIRFENEQSESVRASVGAPGAYSVFGVTPGEWSVRVTGEGLVPSRHEVLLSGGDEPERFDLVVERAVRLRVRLEDVEGNLLEPREGLVAVATLERPPALLPGITGRDASDYGIGRFLSETAFSTVVDEVPPGWSGLLELHDRPPLHVSVVLHNLVIETRLLRSGEEDLVFAFDPVEAIDAKLATATLRVLDETGNPLAGRVGLRHTQQIGLPRETDETGVIHFEGVLPGIMELSFGFPEHEYLTKRVRIVPGVENDLGTVYLSHRRTIGGRVVDEKGEGVSLRLSAVTVGQIDFPHDAQSRRSYRSALDGVFEIKGVGRGEVILTARDDQGSIATMRVDADAKEAQDVLFVLTPGVKVLFDPGGLSRSRAQLTLAYGDGVPFSSFAIWHDYVFEKRLAHGDYEVWLGEDERVDRVLSFTVGAEPVRIDLEEWAVR